MSVTVDLIKEKLTKPIDIFRHDCLSSNNFGKKYYMV